MSKNTNLSFLTDYITADITNGRIGINTPSPTVAFDVVGVAKFSSSVTATNITNNGIYYGKANASFPTTSLGYFALKTNNLDAERGGLTVQVSNSTSTFIDALSINYTGAATFSSSVTAGDLITASYGTARIQITSTTNSVNAGLRFTAKDSTGTNKNAGVYYVAGTTTANSFISLSSDDNTYLFNVLANGNVGIGTTSPSQRLHVYNSSSSTVAIFQGPTNSYIQLGTSSESYIGNVSGALTFEAGGSERMRITSGGQVELNNPVLIGKNTNAGSCIGFTENQIYRTGNGILYLQEYSNNHIVALNGGGNLLIGTSTNLGYRLFANGTAAGLSNWNNVSDGRLKKDITPVVNGLDKIKQLNGVYFNWDKTLRPDLALDDNNHLGLIAQDVEAILPQVVSTSNDEFKTKTIAYSDIVPVLIEAIKELSAEITILKQK